MSLRQDFLKYICQTSPDPIGLRMDHARGAYIYTTEGKRYLDFLSGISVANVGHTHPRVVRAIKKQAEKYLHVMVYGEYIQTPQVRLSKKLASLLPESLSSVYFTNSGTEAVEGALKLAKKFTGRTRLIGFHGSYHGDTHGSLSVTGRDVYRKPFYPLLPNVTLLPFDQSAFSQIDRSVAAVITEPIQGEGGVIVPPPDFLPRLLSRCRKVGALLILDEVQTGMGRTGKMFAFEHSHAIPDILILAKALGGGMPLGAFISSPEIMKCLSVNPPLSHVTTFGGHPVSCAAGLASLTIMLAQNLPKNAMHRGKALQSAIQRLAKQYHVSMEVRGRGLLIGLAFHDSALCQAFVRGTRREGLLVGSTLHTNRVVRITPPLTLSEKEIGQGMQMMEKTLRTITQA